MTNDDVIYRHRLRVLSLAAECGSVAGACRIAGINRSTFSRWKAMAERFGLEILRPRERRHPQMPNAIPVLIEQRVLAFSLGHPGLGPKRISAELGRPLWGGLAISPAGVWRVLARHGLVHQVPPSGPARRLCGATGATEAGAGARAPSCGRPPRRAGADGRLLRGAALGHQGHRLAVHGHRRRQLLLLGRAARDAAQPRRALRKRPGKARGQGAGGLWLALGARDERPRKRVSANHACDEALARLGAQHTLISPGRPQSNGFVERV